MMFQSELLSTFGRPRDPAPYLLTIDLTKFKDALGPVKDWDGNNWNFKLYAHTLMRQPLINAFQHIQDRNLAEQFVTYDGCFNIRKMKGGNSWSVHSWGLAIDINAEWNPFGETPNMSDEFVKCFTDAGFIWGGVWSRPDGMHFQLPRIR